MRKSRSKYLKPTVTQEQRQLISEFCRDLVEKIRSTNPLARRNMFDWFDGDMGLCFNFKNWYCFLCKEGGYNKSRPHEYGGKNTLYYGFVNTYPFGDMGGVFSSNRKRQGFIYSMASKNKS